MPDKQRQIGISRRQALGGIVCAGVLTSKPGPAQAAGNWGRVFIFNTAPEPVASAKPPPPPPIFVPPPPPKVRKPPSDDVFGDRL